MYQASDGMLLVDLILKFSGFFYILIGGCVWVLEKEGRSKRGESGNQSFFLRRNC